MDALIGHSGFVGGNLLRQHRFDGLFNSTNVAEISGQSFNTLVCSAVPATMWLANNNPDADRANILDLFERLITVQADRFVLVSTIGVYKDASMPVDENTTDYQTELAYGRHRREFEQLVTEHFPSTLILRLPALFGLNLKKNFLFDILNPVPSFLKQEVFETVLDGVTASQKDLVLRSFLKDETAGMWRFERTEYGLGVTGSELGTIFENAQLSAIQFTHCDSMFQFYGLNRLWQDIEQAQNADIDVLNLATEPLRAGDIYRALKGRKMTAQTAPIVMQDMRSCHSEHWSRDDGYLSGGDDIMSDLQVFFTAQNESPE